MKPLLILISSLLMTGCLIEPTIITEYKYVEVVKPAAPNPLNLVAPYFYVVSDANIVEFSARIKKENNGVFFALTPGDYENLAANTQEFRRYIKQSQQVITYYEELLSADSTDSGEE